jgi:hypothetical protein
VARSDRPLDTHRKEKLALNCNVSMEDVISAPDADSIYDIPLNFEKDNISERILEKLSLPIRNKKIKNEAWKKMVDTIKHPIHHLTDDEIDHLIYGLEWKYPLSASRGIYNMGTSYEFANIKAVGHEFDSAVFRLMTAINEKYGFKLNSCLLNYYEDGSVMINHHRDNCYRLHGGYDNAIVVSVSYYATRTMEFMSLNKKEIKRIKLDHADILLMGPGCQKYYSHAITKDSKAEGHRINLTFREFI